MPWVDVSILDTVRLPTITKSYVHEQDETYQKATGVMVFTPMSHKMVIDYHGVNPENVTTICTGITGHVGRNFVKAPEKLLMWAGSNFEGKGGYDVIKAFRRIHEIDPEYRLCMIGVKDEVREPGVITYPFLFGDDLKILEDYYRRAQIFVMPSYRECSGLVFFEAMAHKTPIIAPTRGGLAEIIRRSGVGEIVRPGDIQGIVNAILKIANPNVYNEYSTRAYEFSMKNTRWEIATDRMYDAIEKWLSGRNNEIPKDYNFY